MIQEIVTLTTTPGSEAAFEAAAVKAVPLFKRAHGALSWRLDRTIESPNEYTLIVRWETLEDHVVSFRESAGFQQWRELVSPHLTAPPRVKHTQHTYLGF
ncbi:antibiotic biosynthesis monooxygenase family protein [Paenarthrobacter sp. NPDC058040]|uniref:antibiotic biosynthesis monooxygenase family protein n=1 Tax=unclassified Paenarthrobacter TaxID=2634190 RepID=UPI0036DB100A